MFQGFFRRDLTVVFRNHTPTLEWFCSDVERLNWLFHGCFDDDDLLLHPCELPSLAIGRITAENFSHDWSASTAISRVIPHGAFYQADDTPNLLDCLQTAIDKRGIPKAIYVDNGSNYSAKEFGLICTRLGIVLLHTPVRDGAAKGKIERFFRTVREQFLLRELSHIRSLTALNSEFIRWVEDTYHLREHTTLGMKPIDRFGLDLSRIRHLTAVSPYGSELFLLESTRKVRADNTFSYNATHYEAPCDLRNTTITIRHNRQDLHYPPIVYQNSERLGIATPLNRIANDRKPDIEF